MWEKAGVYYATHETNGQKAGSISETIAKGIADMLNNKAEYIKLTPPNGWGSYNGAIDFLTALYKACDAYPNAIIGISK
jgi:hypothetical protein